ncbi:MAG: Type 4 prepilin-like proteins leader peptide-processing enzyme [Candidatus Omnitrophica bacterium]|nr:Type 4 prepilin-like proteins leader peptide-processing enzyme [Candidatus Omnitrophota bacterium]
MAEVILAALLGACVGSFLNVCIVRLPEDRSIVFPASHCVACKKPIRWHDNIPVLSYVLLRGRCRDCRAGISWVYPAVELAGAALFALFYTTFGLTPAGVVYLSMALALLVETVIDMRYQIIPDEITLPGMVIGLIVSTVWPSLHGSEVWWGGALASLAGLLAGGGFLYLAGTLAEKILKKEAMGGGDVKLLAMIGAVIGWQGVLWTVLASSFTGAIAGLTLRWTTGEERIPFGPYLALGAVLYIFFGQSSIRWYIQMIGLG